MEGEKYIIMRRKQGDEYRKSVLNSKYNFVWWKLSLANLTAGRAQWSHVLWTLLHWTRVFSNGGFRVLNVGYQGEMLDFQKVGTSHRVDRFGSKYL
ncbi:MAG: hypothetical protein HQL55_03920 [Magnetococcales bacterium]|nr:hypothetical protein [Magnetococcales bacterium]